MLYRFFIVLALFGIVEARENPFFPVEEEDIPYTTNINQIQESLKRATITLPSEARVLKKVTVEYQNLDGSIREQTIELNNSIDWHLPLFISQSFAEVQKEPHKIDTHFKELGKIEYARFIATNKSFKIVTKDKLIRNFFLTNPHRIVVDFKKDVSMKPYIKSNKNSRFSKIRVGNHSGYYRVVIELDGMYKYTTKEENDGVLFELL